MRTQASGSTAAESKHTEGRQTRKWPRFFGKSKSIQDQSTTPVSLEKDENIKNKPPKWSLGILNDRETDEVPGRSNAASDIGLAYNRRLQAPYCSCQRSQTVTSP